VGVRLEPDREKQRDDVEAREEIRRLFERYRHPKRRAIPAAQRHDPTAGQSEKGEKALAER
jgi:hypothetical protein